MYNSTKFTFSMTVDNDSYTVKSISIDREIGFFSDDENLHQEYSFPAPALVSIDDAMKFFSENIGSWASFLALIQEQRARALGLVKEETPLMGSISLEKSP